MRLLRVFCVVANIFCAIAASSQSIPVEPGLKPFGSFHGGDIDLVSLRDGGLNLRIPLVSWPQRGGLHLGFLIGFNDASIAVTKDFRSGSCDKGCGKDFAPGTADGVMVFPDFLPGVQWSGPFKTTSGELLGQPGGIFDGMGTLHSFFNLYNAESGADNPPPPNNTPIPALDGSGYAMTLVSGSCPSIANYASEIVQDRHGVRYSYPTSCLNPLNVNIEDPNGNQITVSNVALGDLFNVAIPNNPPAGTPTLTDTMGRSIVAPPGPNKGGAAGFGAFGVTSALMVPAAFYFPGPATSTSGCTGSPAAISAQIWTVPGPAGGTQTFKFCFTQIYINISSYSGCNFQNTPSADANCFVDNGPYNRLSSIVLPDGSAWGFIYDSAPVNSSSAPGAPLQIGDLLGITRPTGGTIQYTWGGWHGTDSAHRKGGVITRSVDAKDGSGPQQWNYSGAGTQTQNANGTLNPTQVVTTVTDPLGNIAVHTLKDLSGALSLYETLAQYEDPSGNTLKSVQTSYSQATTTAAGIAFGGVMNVFPLSVTTTLANGLVTKEEKDYDFNPPGNYGGVSFGTVIAERNYDYGNGSPGALLREIDSTYSWQVNSAYQNADILDLPSSVITKDGNGNKLAETDYTYDESQYLTAANISTRHGAAPNPVRGNLTTVSKWLNTSSNPVVSHFNWYDTGELYQAIDPRGNAITHSYDPVYAGAYSTRTCNALNQCVSGTYDFNTGLITSFTDANGSSQASGNTPGDSAHTTTFQYNDPLGRVTQVQGPPDPSSNRPTTSFTYSPANTFPLTVQRQKTITSSLTDSLTTTLDGLGRVYKTQHALPNGRAEVDTSYDGLDHVVSVTNPYFSASDPTYGVIKTQYDALGRVTQVTKQDGSVVVTQYDQTSSTSTDGNCTTTTDEAGKARKSCADGLGRLIEMDEPNPGGIPAGGQTGQQWGLPGDIPVPGDYDGDGKTDFAIWRPSTATWWVLRSSDGTWMTQPWGQTGDIPVPGDYDGDGKTDFAIWRPSTATWWVLRSSDGQEVSQPWGSSGDTPVPGDYDGDGKTDFAIWRPSTATWWVLRSSDGVEVSQPWGIVGDVPEPGDYDGDGKNDYAVWRPSTATWWVLRSSDGTWMTQQWGASGYMPVAGTYQGGSLSDFAVWNPSTGIWYVSTPYVTQYSYDALGNLLNATQKGDPLVTPSSQWRVRNFTYDSLSRLLTATNPESGTITYSYDADGNVLSKTAPAPNQTGSTTQTISYCYDALNRVTGKAYTSQSCPLSTPVVTYTYDAGANGIGHLTSLTDQAGSGSYCYDALGRITGEQRAIAGVQKTLSYTYNLDSSAATLTYPSGAVITYTPDSAGRMLSAVDKGSNINYVTNAGYGPDSSLTGFLSGSSSSFSGISNSWQYNQRLQICRITAQTTGNVPTSCTDSSDVGNILDLGYDLNLGNGDNGNVIGITNYKDTSRSQSFSYDALNRLTSAQNAGTNCSQETAAGAGEYWGNSYSYDAWGNLLSKSVTKCSAENLNVTALANNQLSGYSYDAAGNMTRDATTGNSYSYDAENRITGVAGYTYTYDVDGNRVEKSNGSTGTIYWYMSPGIVAESDLSGNLQHEYIFFNGRRVARKDLPGGAVSYYFSDDLKTASVITNSAGTITEDEDFYPWGGEIPFLNGDSNHYKYGGHERDTETGLDYMLARYYSNPLGRFLTPDWAAKPITVPYADYGNPQSLNLYTYGKNNPTTLGDDDGHDPDPQQMSSSCPSCHDKLHDLDATQPPPQTQQPPTTQTPPPPPPVPVGCTLCKSASQDNSGSNTPPSPGTNSQSGSQSTTAPGPGQGSGENQGKGQNEQSQKSGAQDKKLSNDEVKQLEQNTGQSAHEIKGDIVGKNVSKYDLYKNANGDIVVKPKGSSGPGEPTGYTTEHLKPPTDNQ